VVVSLLFGFAVGQWREVRSFNGGLSRTADPWTEADTLRAAAGYAQLGLLANWGLPDLCFGDQFADSGMKNLLRQSPHDYSSWRSAAVADRSDAVGADRFIYTHYPPGPHLLAAAMASVLGPDRVNAYRLLPLTAGLLAILYLTRELARRFGAVAAAASLCVFAALPMFTNMMHGLSYQGYALALLLVELGLCLRLSTRDWRAPRILLALAATGFLQGWLGFDYVFIVTLAPITLWMALEETPASARRAVAAGAVVAAGFTLAHALHLAQVIGYYGSAHEALADLMSVARYRSMGAVLDNGLELMSTPRLLWNYLTVRTATRQDLGVSAMFVCAAVVCSLLMAQLASRRHTWFMPIGAVMLALLASSGWVMVMPQHAAQHSHFIPRHYFLTVFVSVVAVCSMSQRLLPIRREQFPVLWLAIPPVVMVLARLFQHSAFKPIATFVVRLATPEGLIAYALTAGLLVVLANWRRSWSGVIRRAPLIYCAVLGVCILVAEFLEWRVMPGEMALVRWLGVVPLAIVVGYALILAGWAVQRLLHRRGHFSQDWLQGGPQSGLIPDSRIRQGSPAR